MDNIQIFKMTKEDIEPSLLLEKSQETHILNSNILNEDITKENYYYIVAKNENNTIVGYAGISYILDSADLISIVVDKSHSNRGIASLMLTNIFDFCKEHNIQEIMLEVRTSNVKARNLYLKHGFKEISIRKNYYDNIEDAIIMKKEL